MQVTFDTNVWKRLVFPERYLNSPNYAALGMIKNAVQSGLIRGFISESFGTIEAVKKENRARVHAEDIPAVEVTNKSEGDGLVCMTFNIKANHSLHPGIGEKFEEELNEALAIGMKLLTAPYIGVRIPARFVNDPHIYASEVFAKADYNERFGEVAKAIAARGVGGGALATIAKQFTERLNGPRPDELSDRGLINAVYEYACSSGLSKDKERIEKVFAEVADGDVVAAHVAFGNDYLCTDDHGKSAGSPSIFDDRSRTWLKTMYKVKILSSQQLSNML